MGGLLSSQAESQKDELTDVTTLAREPPTPTAVDCRSFLKQSEGKVSDFYERVRDLGEGGYGEVWLARQRVRAASEQEHAGRLVAVKRVRKPNADAGLDEADAASQEALEEFRTEVELLRSLDHPSICRLLQVYEDTKNLYLVMEHITGGELFEHVVDLGNFGEHDAAQVMRQVASALVYCHDRGVVHRDIKPENILVVASDDPSEDAELTVKLIDFGFGCRILEGVKLKAKVGTFVYTAPEVLNGESCNEKQDLWSLGCVLFVLLSGDSPFFGDNCKQNIMDGVFAMEGEAWEVVSRLAKDVVLGLLKVNPEERLSAAKLLEHTWLQQEKPRTGAEATSLKPAQLSALESFHSKSVFRRVASAVLAKQLDEGLLHQLHCAFCAADTDGNGVISFEEFKRILRDFDLNAGSHRALAPGAGKVADIFHGVDMDGQGTIDYTEFVAACLDHKIEDEESICWSAFQVFDKDSSGEISFDELEQVLNTASMQDTFPSDVREQLWQRLCENKANESDPVDFDHFLAALRGVRPSAVKAQPGTSDSAGAASGKAGFGLPIARRHQGAAAAMGLPIKSRAQPAGLPVESRAAAAFRAGGLGLPIKRRHDEAPAHTAAESAGLPIKSRH
eukprot:TRINITY_DN10132_c0_g1_i1.p1 TRINITY_DN10132_c0_g1~~TRINITY_DN10132_c0_g1_i1.p1  ORF type:complete len:621 (+),score=124.86 TRINITY_DN10132_c0_g1_i1:29-1891(+)